MTAPSLRRMALLLLVFSVARASAQRVVEGTSQMSGVVVGTGANARPLARVLVTVSGAALKSGRTVITDTDGRFNFVSLPAGRFTVTASRSPYVTTSYGAKRPGRPGTPIDLAVGQRLDGLSIPLALGAVATGAVRSKSGEPMPGVVVNVMPLDTQIDLLAAPVVTDDRGMFRAYGLVPGRYVVRVGGADRSAVSAGQMSDAEIDALIAKLRQRSSGISQPTLPAAAPVTAVAQSAPIAFGLAPIYFPGTTDPDEAETLTLAEGEERSGIDIEMQLVRTVSVAGRVAVPEGTMAGTTNITLTRVSERRVGTENVITPSAANLDGAGNFRFQNVVPGRYRLSARAMLSSAAGAIWASSDVAVAGDDVAGVALQLQPGLRMTGLIVFDARSAARPDPSTIRLRLIDTTGATSWVPVGSGRATGEFEISGIIPGTYTLASSLTESGWSLRSVMAGDRDILDAPLEVGGNGDVTGVVVTFSDMHTELSGRLQAADGAAAPGYFVVAVSADRAFWRPGSRRVQFARPSTDGRFVLRDLPAGDYVLAAVTDMDASDLSDPAFMSSLLAAGVKVTLAAGETKTQDLKIGGGQPSILR